MEVVRIVFLAVIGILLLGALVLMWYPGTRPRQHADPGSGGADSRSRLGRPEAAVGFFATLTVALFAHDPWVYAVALFVVASLLTDQGYLERVAAILRGDNSGYWKYLESTPAAIEEKRRRDALELADAEQAERTLPATASTAGAPTNSPSQPHFEASVQPTPTAMSRVASFEAKAASALAHAFLAGSAIQSNMVLTSPDRRLLEEIDFIVHTTRGNVPTILLIEAKASGEPDIVRRAVMRARKCANILRQSRTFDVPLIQPAVIIPSTYAGEIRMMTASDTVVLLLNTDTEKFENSEQVASMFGLPLRTQA